MAAGLAFEDHVLGHAFDYRMVVVVVFVAVEGLVAGLAAHMSHADCCEDRILAAVVVVEVRVFGSAEVSVAEVDLDSADGVLTSRPIIIFLNN